MNLTLMLIGAGEHTSLVDGTTDSYFRFRAADGAETNLQCTPEQLAALLRFAADHVGLQQPVAKRHTSPDPTPTDLYPADPTITDDAEEDDQVVRLRAAHTSPFAMDDDL